MNRIKLILLFLLFTSCSSEPEMWTCEDETLLIKSSYNEPLNKAWVEGDFVEYYRLMHELELKIYLHKNSCEKK
jgi:hypothetical protein